MKMKTLFATILFISLYSNGNFSEAGKSTLSTNKCDSNSQDCLKAESRTMFRVESKMSVSSSNTTILNLVTPLNRCVEKECKYCCLSINRCGTKKQCKNSKKTLKILKLIFYLLVGLCVIILIVKICQNSTLPEQNNGERVDTKIISELLELYGIIRTNRQNIIVS